MGLEIGGLIGNQGVGGGMRLVEAVAGELGHEVEDIFGLVGGMTVLIAPAMNLAFSAAIASGIFLPMARRSRSASPSE
jgi:hypothetical protein